jgi:DNA polymerase (family 10)
MGLDRMGVAAAVREIGTRLQAQGGAAFRAKAYRRGADALEALSGDLGDLIASGGLTRVPGIGQSLAAVIEELHRTGRSSTLERLRATMPAGLMELRGLPGMTPARVALIEQELGVRSLDELKAAADDGRLGKVKGFGPATVKKVLEAIEQRTTTPARTLLAEALRLSDEIVTHLRGAGVEVELVGDLRRGVEEVERIELLAAGADPAPLLDAFTSVPRAAAVEERTEGSARVRLAGGPAAELFVTAPAARAMSLVVLTGARAHLEALADRAASRGLRIGTDGLRDTSGRPVPIAEEAGVYERLGLPWIPPELREGEGEIEEADRGATFEDLVQVSDLQGLVHCHTVYSDGRHTVKEMATAAERMGMRYLTITDHSPTAFYANGVKLDRLRRQWDEIAEVQETVSVRLLRGTESDILEDGSLDYPDAILEQMDVVIASVHNRHKMDEREMTRRITRAMQQKVFKVWGHALGRLLQKRPSFAVRMEEVLDTIAASRAAIEVNGDPRRLEMEPRFIRAARARGIPFVVSTDAHSTGELRNVRYGTIIARRGGLRRHEVLNTRDVDGFRDAVRPAARA